MLFLNLGIKQYELDMRTILLVLIFCVYLSTAQGQEQKNYLDKNKCLESLVDDFFEDDLFENIFSLTKEEFKRRIQQNQSLTIISNDELRNFIYNLNEYSLVLCLRSIIDEEILELKYYKDIDDYHVRIKNLNEKLKIVDDFINVITSNDYLHYNIQQSSKTWIKSFHLYHENDFFLFSKLNADRDYTGGFRFELMTDQFKMRIFKKLGNSDHFLSYQSIFLGGEAYTPYIRFTEDELNERGVLYKIDNETNFFTDASLASIENYMRSNQQFSDRPFASFQYLGRGKYRLHNDGFLRSESLFKLGIVGKNLGENIQAVIHKDLTTGSQRVLNWEDQIANGGRLAFNIEHKVDISLFSTNSLTSLNKEYKNDFVNFLAFNTNLYLPLELAFGTVQTHVGGGLGISNKSFIDVSGINDPKYFKEKSPSYCNIDSVGLMGWIKSNPPKFIMLHLKHFWLNSYISLEYNYRYIQHNSMLEGVGFFNTFPEDPLDDEAITIYSLDKESIERNLHKIQLHIGYRMNKVTLYYKQTRYINKEFEVIGIVPNYEEFTTKRWYGYGRIGLKFIL